MLDILPFKYSSQKLELKEFHHGKKPRTRDELNSYYDTKDYLYKVTREDQYGNALSQMYYYYDGGRGKFKVHHTEHFLGKNKPYLIYVEYQPDSSSPGPSRQMKFVLSKALGKQHIDNIKSGRAKIWFDCTPEERVHAEEINDDNISKLMKFLDKNKIPQESILYTDGDLLVDELFEKYGKVNTKVLPLHMNNAWESFERFAKDNMWSRLIVNQEYFLRPKHFMFNNFMPRTARTILMSKLVKSGIYKKGFCSFQDIGKDGNIFFPSMGDASFDDRSFNIYQICRTGDVKGFDKYLDILRPVLPLSHDMVGIKQEDTLDNLDYTTARIDDAMTLVHSYDSALEDKGKRVLTHYDSTYGPYYNPISYLNVYFDVCAETFSGGFGDYDIEPLGPVFTEKIWRPLALGTPFIPIAEPGSVRALKKLGFKLYDKMFDYSFDDEKDGHKRIEMIYDNIKRLTDMSRDELHKLTYQHKKDMVYNHEYFINDFYHNVYNNHLEFLNGWVK